MIRSLSLLVALATCLPAAAVAEEPAPAVATEATPGTASAAAPAEAPPAEGAPAAKPGEEPEDTSLEEYRAPLDVLNERMIGHASKSVRFDWRRTTVGFAGQFSELLEKNNFGSTRVGGHVRRPLGPVMGELGLNWVFSWGTDSTEKLALTPYRQAGRPSRLELDVNAAFPLAEGVATAWPGFFPATELVFSAVGGLRYLFYPGAFEGAKWTEVGRALFAPELSELELDNVEKRRPAGMQVDEARYALLTGLSLDVYFQNGIFISPRALVALPVFALLSDSKLGVWWELTIAGGWTF